MNFKFNMLMVTLKYYLWRKNRGAIRLLLQSMKHKLTVTKKISGAIMFWVYEQTSLLKRCFKTARTHKTQSGYTKIHFGHFPFWLYASNVSYFWARVSVRIFSHVTSPASGCIQELYKLTNLQIVIFHWSSEIIFINVSNYTCYFKAAKHWVNAKSETGCIHERKKAYEKEKFMKKSQKRTH